jgi:putative SOS response-associated peptidase YedK
MCGRYSLTVTDPSAVRARFPIGESLEIRARYNVAPTDEVLAVTADREGHPRGEMLRWGLIPSWAKSPNVAQKMINARVETVAERPAFRRSFERMRCLIPADGFYEWKTMPGGPKQPFRITRSDGALFAFAGLWSIWHGEDDRQLRTCTILTTRANDALAPLHDRMPVILSPEQEAEWLDTTTPTLRLDQILMGLPAEAMALSEVSPAINDVRCDSPECLAPPTEAPRGEQPTLF